MQTHHDGEDENAHGLQPLFTLCCIQQPTWTILHHGTCGYRYLLTLCRARDVTRMTTIDRLSSVLSTTDAITEMLPALMGATSSRSNEDLRSWPHSRTNNRTPRT